jgi:hypothetical protein
MDLLGSKKGQTVIAVINGGNAFVRELGLIRTWNFNSGTVVRALLEASHLVRGLVGDFMITLICSGTMASRSA